MVKLTRLRYWRERNALTQAGLAAAAGVERKTVLRIEAGVVDPHPSTTRKLAAALGVEPDALMAPEELAMSRQPAGAKSQHDA